MHAVLRFFARFGRAITSDWRYPAGLALLVLSGTLAFSQWRDWTEDGNARDAAELAIRQNDDLRLQLEAFSDASACRSRLVADVDVTKGDFLRAQGAHDVAQAKVTRIFNDALQVLGDRAAVEAAVAAVPAAQAEADEAAEALVAADKAYGEALDRRARQTEICDQQSVTTSTAPPAEVEA